MDLVDELVAARAAEHPSKCAIIEGDRRFSYADVTARAEEQARRLAALGVGHGDRVAICLDRSAELAIAELACLRLGAVYVPIAVSQPDARTRLMVETSGARAIVRAGPFGAIEIASCPEDSAALRERAGARGGADAAYVMFTSGSTGAPKGVVVPHRAIVGLATADDCATVGPQDVIAFASNPAFDASTWEVWGALTRGATLAVVSRDTVVSPTRLAAAVRGHGITAMFLTTALFNHVVRTEPASLQGLRVLLFGGETCDVEAVQRACSAAVVGRLVHVYGPTECTTFALFHEVGSLGRDDVTAGGTTVPIGRPIAGTTAHVLDDEGSPVVDGAPGELYLGGDRLALGYLGDEALTASRFVPDHVDPGGNRRLYRTGDLVRRRPDGLIDYLGRRDRQVKVRGFRVQLEELEVVATGHSCVRRAVAFVRPGPDGNELALVAESDAVDDAELRSHLARCLPPETVPARIAVVPGLPLNANGKVDQGALESLLVSAGRGPADRRRASEDVDPRVAAAWQRAVGSPFVDPDASYFDLGMGSLQAARMLAEVKSATGVDLPLSSLVDHPTLRSLSAAIATRRGGNSSTPESDPAIAELRPGNAPPLVLIHCYEGAAFFYRPLLKHLRSERAVLALNELRFAGRWRGGESTEGIAEACLRGWDDVRTDRPRRVLAGYSAGGGIAYEMTRQLLERGVPVDGPVLLDPASAVPMYDRQLPPGPPPAEPGPLAALAGRWQRASSWCVGFARRRALDLRFASDLLGIRRSIEKRNRLNFDRHWALMTRYRPKPLPRRVPTLFVACLGGRSEATLELYLEGWRALLGESAEVHLTTGSHSGDQSFLVEPHVVEVARWVGEFLSALESR